MHSTHMHMDSWYPCQGVQNIEQPYFILNQTMHPRARLLSSRWPLSLRAVGLVMRLPLAIGCIKQHSPLLICGLLSPISMMRFQRCCSGGLWKFRPFGVLTTCRHSKYTGLNISPSKCSCFEPFYVKQMRLEVLHSDYHLFRTTFTHVFHL